MGRTALNLGGNGQEGAYLSHLLMGKDYWSSRVRLIG
jgi:GDP-D-mannose dehydratase